MHTFFHVLYGNLIFLAFIFVCSTQAQIVGFKVDKVWISHPIFNKIFLFILAVYYVYMPVHFFASNGKEELIRLYLWVNMGSFYFLPIVLLTFKFSFEL